MASSSVKATKALEKNRRKPVTLYVDSQYDHKSRVNTILSLLSDTRTDTFPQKLLDWLVRMLAIYQGHRDHLYFYWFP